MQKVHKLMMLLYILVKYLHLQMCGLVSYYVPKIFNTDIFYAMVDIIKSLNYFRFNCMICLCPRLQMVSGYCQHRICTQCLYNEDSIRKPSLDKCPTCQKEEAFPVIRYISDCRSCKNLNDSFYKST